MFGLSAWTVAVGVEVDMVRGSSVRVGRSLRYGLARHYGAHHILAASTDRADRRTKPVSPIGGQGYCSPRPIMSVTPWSRPAV